MAGIAARHGTATALLAVMLCAAAAAPAQEIKGLSQCKPDELDMGDYCARLQPPDSEKEAALRRVTPFRAHSMMPGRVGEPAPEGQQPAPTGPASASAKEYGPVGNNALHPMRASESGSQVSHSVVADGETVHPGAKRRTVGGFGVQLGVFSDRARAIKVAQPLAEQGIEMMLVPVHRADRTLWACIHGPFPDEQSAVAAAGRLRIDHRVYDTYIKSLENLDLTELSHDTTEK